MNERQSELRLKEIVNNAFVNTDISIDDSIDWFSLINTAVQSEIREIQVATMGLVVARTNRSGPAKSFKTSNVNREYSRTIYVVALLSLFLTPSVNAIALLIGITYASFNALSAPVGYSDACVLHKAWTLAKNTASNEITLEELLSVRNEIVNEYQAPKCGSENEIRDAVENLKGLRAITQQGDTLVLNEHIIFLS